MGMLQKGYIYTDKDADLCGHAQTFLFVVITVRIMNKNMLGLQLVAVAIVFIYPNVLGRSVARNNLRFDSFY